MSVAIDCNDCGKGLDVGDETYCLKCWEDLENQYNMAVEKINELEKQIEEMSHE